MLASAASRRRPAPRSRTAAGTDPGDAPHRSAALRGRGRRFADPAAALTWMRTALRSVSALRAWIQRRLHRLLPAGTGFPPPPPTPHPRRLVSIVIHR